MANGKILLVEGTDDEHVLKHICGNRDIPHLDEVEKYGSVEKLIESIGVRLPLLIQEGDAIGIVIDADTDISAVGSRSETESPISDIKMCLINQTRTGRSSVLRQERIYRDWASGLCRIIRQMESWRISCTPLFHNLTSFLTMREIVSQLFLKANGVLSNYMNQRRSSILGLLGRNIQGGLSERLSPPTSLIPMSQK